MEPTRLHGNHVCCRVVIYPLFVCASMFVCFVSPRALPSTETITVPDHYHYRDHTPAPSCREGPTTLQHAMFLVVYCISLLIAVFPSSQLPLSPSGTTNNSPSTSGSTTPLARVLARGSSESCLDSSSSSISISRNKEFGGEAIRPQGLGAGQVATGAAVPDVLLAQRQMVGCFVAVFGC